MTTPRLNHFESYGWKSNTKTALLHVLANNRILTVDKDDPKIIRIWDRKGKKMVKYKSPISCYEIFTLPDGRLLYGNPVQKRIFSPKNKSSFSIPQHNIHLSSAIAWKNHTFACVSSNKHKYTIEIFTIHPTRLRSIHSLPIDEFPITLASQHEHEIIVGLNTGAIQYWKQQNGRFDLSEKIPGVASNQSVEKKFLAFLANDLLVDINITSESFIRYLKKSNKQWECIHIIPLPNINSRDCRLQRETFYFHKENANQLSTLDLYNPTQIKQFEAKQRILNLTTGYDKTVLQLEDRISIQDEKNVALKEIFYLATPFCSNISNVILDYCRESKYQSNFFNKSDKKTKEDFDHISQSLLGKPSLRA